MKASLQDRILWGSVGAILMALLAFFHDNRLLSEAYEERYRALTELGQLKARYSTMDSDHAYTCTWTSLDQQVRRMKGKKR